MHTSRGRIAGTLSMAIAVVLAVHMFQSTSNPIVVEADHESSDSHLTDINDFPVAGERIVRNVIEGIQIRVCSDVYPASTREAVLRWNNMMALSSNIFVFQPTGGSPIQLQEWCNPEQQIVRYGITGVVVLRETSEFNCTNAACIDRVTPNPNERWDTYVGRIEIYIGDYDTGGAVREVLDDGDLRVTRSIAHELESRTNLDMCSGSVIILTVLVRRARL